MFVLQYNKFFAQDNARTFPRPLESLAILWYLVDKYDKDHKLSSTGLDKYTELQWLAFQASGQGCVLLSPTHFSPDAAIQSVLRPSCMVREVPP